MSDAGQSVPVVEIGDVPSCPRCGAEGLLRARIPNGWTNAHGTTVSGHLPVVLCSTCDIDRPAAGALITFLHVHESVTDATAAAFADLATAWIASIKIGPVSDAELEADITAWRAGEFDD